MVERTYSFSPAHAGGPYISEIKAQTETSLTFDGHFYRAKHGEWLPREYIMRRRKEYFHVEILTYEEHEDTSEYWSDEEFGPGKICLFPTCIQTITWRVIRPLTTKEEIAAADAAIRQRQK